MSVSIVTYNVCRLRHFVLWNTDKQGVSKSEVIICFVRNLSYQQILQLFRAITVGGFYLNVTSINY